MDYSREKISSATAPVTVYLLFRFPPFPLTINSHRYSPITPARHWFRGAERHAQTAFLVCPCLSNTSLAAERCAREAAGAFDFLSA
jgi:hypothetical protein